MEALKKQETALECNPKLWRAFERKGRILRLLKDYKGAIKAQDESLKINRHNVVAFLEKAECYRAIGDHKRAREMQKKAQDEDLALYKLWDKRTCDRS